MPCKLAGLALATTILSVGVLSSPALASNRPLRLVYIQGFLSCSLDYQIPADTFFDQAKNHPDAKLYYGCFDGGFAEHPSDLTEHFFVYTRRPSEPWSAPQEFDAQSAPLAIALMLHHEIAALAANNPETQDTSPLMNLEIAGHSHGGWIAMRVAYQAALIPRIKLKQLLTVDPISYVECSSEWFPWHAINSTFNWLGDHEACHRAPQDLEALGPTIFTAVNFHWDNVYETSQPYLSSGPVRHATRNIEFTADSTLDWLTAHRAIIRSPETWRRFFNRQNAIIQNPDDDEN